MVVLAWLQDKLSGDSSNSSSTDSGIHVAVSKNASSLQDRVPDAQESGRGDSCLPRRIALEHVCAELSCIL